MGFGAKDKECANLLFKGHGLHKLKGKGKDCNLGSPKIFCRNIFFPSLKPTLKIQTQIASSFNLSITSTPVSITKSSLKPTLKIPTQITSISNLSISSTPVSVTKSSLKSTLSANPLQDPLYLTPRRHSDPSNAAALRRVSVVLFRTDLRVQDNESLTLANNESVSVLPVYCFDPNGFDKFDKSCNKVSFLIESVSDLRKNLQAKGSDLVVRGVGKDEVRGEKKVESGLKDEGVEVKWCWGGTLYHVDDLPFEVENMPSEYGGFREKVKGVKVRGAVECVDQLKGLPSCGNVEVGEIPSLADLGLGHTANMAQVKPVINGPLIGGETEALNRLKKFAAECQAHPPKQTNDGNNDSVYGASFSCKISPWLALGCISPRAVFDELKNSASRSFSAGSIGKDGGDSGMNWLMYELLWRDFFRFITWKYRSSKQHNSTPVPA
ncbi:putative (6-4)DNA photolyase [Helianthus annuus]|uniref:(6-4)DNA photolyase n=1 Tax=Helianthus annuus TaxID=4232 RepID=A0A251S4U0_HELAN|nr:putative (6-4)DNA photolyase [Helianthus annuus]